MESEDGSWDFVMEVGIDNAAMPASILFRQRKNALMSVSNGMSCVHTDVLLV